MKRLLLAYVCISLVLLSCQSKQYLIISNESGAWSCSGLAQQIGAALNPEDTVDSFCSSTDTPPSDLTQYDGILTWLNGVAATNALIERALTNYLVARRGIVVFASFSLYPNLFSPSFLASYSPLAAQSSIAMPCLGDHFGSSCSIAATTAKSPYSNNLQWNSGGFYFTFNATLCSSGCKAEIQVSSTFQRKQIQIIPLAATRQLSSGGITGFLNFYPFDNYPSGNVARLLANAVSYPFPEGNIVGCKNYSGLNCKVCEKGYNISTSGQTCDDINECAANATLCPYGATCVNTVGSYTCSDYCYFLVSSATNFTIEGSGVSASRPFMTTMKNSSFQNQLWRFTSQGFVKNCGSGLVLDSKGREYFSGSEVVVYRQKSPLTEDPTNQYWSYDKNTMLIRSVGNSNFVLDVYAGSTATNTPLVLWTVKDPSVYGGNLNQKWTRVIPTTQP